MASEIGRIWLELGDQRLEAVTVGPVPAAAATIVMLHEGLGSADLWGELPAALARATGYGVVAYSRAGHGRSSPKPLPWPSQFMHDEALEVLPRVLEEIGFERGILVGASDGSSIATIYAGTVRDERVRGLSLTAPHFIVEEETLAGARTAGIAYEQGDLKRKLARWHENVDMAFYGWNQAFSDREFKRTWSIVGELGRVTAPMQILQGERDEYGTPRQIAIAERECKCVLEWKLLAGLGHSLHREAPEVTTTAIAAFARKVLG